MEVTTKETPGRGWQYAIDGIWDNRLYSSESAAQAAATDEIDARGFSAGV